MPSFHSSTSGTEDQEILYNILVKEISSTLIFLGGVLITLAAVALFLIFYPVIALEIGYLINGPGKGEVSAEKIPGKDVMVPRDTEFGIVIPKIRANARIVANVNPYDAREYQAALTRGVAHAKGTALPGDAGNMFLFSHSSVDFYNAARYNSIFYLLEKLEKNDEIFIFYKGAKYKYKVTDKKTVDAKAVSYLSPIRQPADERLTLMTCWPPGTTWKRLLIIADAVSQ